MSEYNFIHEKRKGGKKPSHQQTNTNVSSNVSSDLNAEPMKFDFDEIHGMKLKEVVWEVPDQKVRKRRRSQFSNVRKEFLQEIGRTHEEQLRALGMTEKQIDMVKKGATPNGFNVHHKLPIHGGGLNEFSNFILMPIPPHDDLHHLVMDPQVANLQTGAKKRVLIPWSDDMVYVDPEHKQYRTNDENSTKKGSKKNQHTCAAMDPVFQAAFAARGSRN
ncbi:MAG: hypothetical protein MJ247_00300 [Alphaproteobacteria bacterium]|nr:hypothetical protein [Alphaproteobacteria bacterium]